MNTNYKGITSAWFQAISCHCFVLYIYKFYAICTRPTWDPPVFTNTLSIRSVKLIDFTSQVLIRELVKWNNFKGGRKPQGAVKPTWGLESNPGRSGERRTCYHGATKPRRDKTFLQVRLQ